MNDNHEKHTRLSGARMVMRALDNRLRLGGLELQEARSEVVGIGALTLVAVALLQLTAMAAFVVLVAMTWDTPWRVWAPGLAGGGLAALALVVARWAWRRTQDWSPMEETLGVLSRDARSLRMMMRASETENESKD